MASVRRINVFTHSPGGGNLAGVVLDAEALTDAEMQTIATDVGASETVFVLPSSVADLRVRWFTPANEVGMCVHATIAAVGLWTAMTGTRRARVTVETRNAVLQVTLRDGLVFVNVPALRVAPDVVDIALVERYLGVGIAEIVDRPRIISIFDERELVLEAASLSTLERLTPSVETYGELCRTLMVEGISLFSHETYDAGHDVHLREFAPLFGYLEDPLCGTAAGCVMTSLRLKVPGTVTQLRVEQGHFCNTFGTIYVEYQQESGIWVGGGWHERG